MLCISLSRGIPSRTPVLSCSNVAFSMHYVIDEYSNTVGRQFGFSMLSQRKDFPPQGGAQNFFSYICDIVGYAVLYYIEKLTGSVCEISEEMVFTEGVATLYDSVNVY